MSKLLTISKCLQLNCYQIQLLAIVKNSIVNKKHQSILNEALVIEVVSNAFSERNKNFGRFVVKNIFPLEFTKYLSYLELQKNSKIVNV